MTVGILEALSLLALSFSWGLCLPAQPGHSNSKRRREARRLLHPSEGQKLLKPGATKGGESWGGACRCPRSRPGDWEWLVLLGGGEDWAGKGFPGRQPRSQA